MAACEDFNQSICIHTTYHKHVNNHILFLTYKTAYKQSSVSCVKMVYELYHICMDENLPEVSSY